jgi:hypothetical protein
MFCAICGRENADTFAFCSSCGARLGEAPLGRKRQLSTDLPKIVVPRLGAQLPECHHGGPCGAFIEFRQATLGLGGTSIQGDPWRSDRSQLGYKAQQPLKDCCLS